MNTPQNSPAKVLDEEQFADLVPQYKTLARGFLHELYAKAPISDGMCVFLTLVVLIALGGSVSLAVFASIEDPAGGRWVELGFASVWMGFMFALIVGFGQMGIREELLKRKAVSWTLSERSDLAKKVLNLAYTVEFSKHVDPHVIRKADSEQVKRSEIYRNLQSEIDDLREKAEHVAEELLSNDPKSLAHAFESIAGYGPFSLFEAVRTIRQIVDAAPHRLEQKIHERELKAESQRLISEVKKEHVHG